jgi:GNAT superfamily N-acetyltransferase
MIKIDLLKNHPHTIPKLAPIWQEALGKMWLPDVQIQEIESWFYEWLNNDIPLAYIALYNDTPVGCCSLQLNDGIRPDLKPWLGDLVVTPKYQKQGIGKMLIDTTKQKAFSLGFKKLYLFTFDLTLVNYYVHLGWNINGKDEFKTKSVTIMEILL